MRKLIETMDNYKVELVARPCDNYTDLHIKLSATRRCLNTNSQDLSEALRNGLDINCSAEEMIQRIEPILTDFSTKKNCTRSAYDLFIRCYTEPQIERGYQAMLELWQAIKTAAATTPPRRLVAENKLKELFK